MEAKALLSFRFWLYYCYHAFLTQPVSPTHLVKAFVVVKESERVLVHSVAPSLESSAVLWKPVTRPRHQQGSLGPQKTFACCQYRPFSGLQVALGTQQIVLVARGFCVDLGVSLKIPPINSQSRS